MVTLCKQKYDINDNTLYNLVTEAFPIIVFTKKLEDNTRKIMEITECEVLPDRSRRIRTLFCYDISENQNYSDGVRVNGSYEKVNDISDSLKKRLLENGISKEILARYLSGGDS